MFKLIRVKRAIMLLSLVIAVISSCTKPKTYIHFRKGSDQILEGSVQKDVLYDALNFPWYNYEYKTYKVDSISLQGMKSEFDSLQFLVFGGTWCSDTQRELPRFIKICDTMGVQSDRMQLFMLDQQKKSAYIHVKVWQVTAVPTFIVMRNGKEIGRIVETPQESLEKHLRQIIKQ
jgi:thiol-disulfide isomerase/thioredoxin